MNDTILEPGQNTGVRIDPISPIDWIAGGETGATKEVLRADGQYDDYGPSEETQQIASIDVLACVSFSALNVLEFIFTYKLANNLFSQKQVDFLKNEGYIEKTSGKVNFSDRYTAKLSGTSKSGNSLEAVADSIRKYHGVVPEKDWLPPQEMLNETDSEKKWQLYYATVDEAVVAKGKRFLDHFLIEREWVIIDGLTKDPIKAVKDNLPYGPMQIAAAVCPPWSSNEGMPPIQGCGCTTQHATVIYGYEDGVSFKDFDHYKSYRKKLGWDYCIPYAVQYTVKEKTEVVYVPKNPNHVFNTNLRFGNDSGVEVHKLQEALQFLKRKDGKPYMKAGLFGPYGPQTKVAVGLLQTDHGIKDPGGQGTNFGPKTRAITNNLLK